MTRREALGVLGAAAASPLVAQSGVTFPKGAVIRTLLKDLDPAELAGGATLFHEHMQLGTDFNAKFNAASAAVRAANAPPAAAAPKPAADAPKPLPAAAPKPAAAKGPDIMRDPDLMAAEVAKVKDAGVKCIVDAGHADMGRDIGFLRQVAMKCGVPIVAGGGFYSQPFYPKEIATWSEEQRQAMTKQAQQFLNNELD